MSRRPQDLLHRRITFLMDGVEYYGYISAIHRETGQIDARVMTCTAVVDADDHPGKLWQQEVFPIPTTCITGLEE